MSEARVAHEPDRQRPRDDRRRKMGRPARYETSEARLQRRDRRGGRGAGGNAARRSREVRELEGTDPLWRPTFRSARNLGGRHAANPGNRRPRHPGPDRRVRTGDTPASAPDCGVRLLRRQRPRRRVRPRRLHRPAARDDGAARLGSPQSVARRRQHENADDALRARRCARSEDALPDDRESELCGHRPLVRQRESLRVENKGGKGRGLRRLPERYPRGRRSRATERRRSRS